MFCTAVGNLCFPSFISNCSSRAVMFIKVVIGFGEKHDVVSFMQERKIEFTS
jgi:hypothetical protein